jgi:hypothetical protein
VGSCAASFARPALFLANYIQPSNNQTNILPFSGIQPPGVMPGTAGDGSSSDPQAKSSQDARKESEALIARVNAKMARFQQALEAQSVEAKAKQSERAKRRTFHQPEKTGDDEDIFNAVAESA